MTDPMDAVRADPRDGSQLSEEEWRRIHHNMSKALITLLVHFPYFGSMTAAMASDRVWVTERERMARGAEFDTLATDGRRLYLWPPFVLHVPPKFLAGALLHELLHNVLLHPLRGVGFDPLLANQAMDYCVNLLVNDAALRTAKIMPGTPMQPSHYAMPHVHWYIPVDSEFCVDERFRDERGEPMMWERIYAMLDDQRPESRLLDSHAVWQPGKRPAGDDGQSFAGPFDPDAVRRWAAAAQQFRHDASSGFAPAGLLRAIDRWLDPPLPWQSLLQAYLATTPGDFAWAPGDLRFADPMPYWTEQPKLSWIGFGFDLSASMDDRQIAAAVENARSILRSFPGTKGRAYFWDAEVHDACDLDDFDGVVRAGVHGGGGTRIAPQFDAIREDGLKPNVHVCFTDGLVDWSEVDPDRLDHDVLWVLTRDGEGPPAHPRYRTTRLETR